MPFPQQEPRLYTRADVEALSPGQLGVYGLYRAGLWVYVGNGDIRQRLLDHLNGDNPCISASGPTHWVSAVTSAYDQLERQLILELSPVCNQRVG